MAMNPRLLRPRATAAYDPEAQVYFNAVAVADGQQLEPAVKKAISDFVRGCKADGIWDSLKASCILAGARTLSGALVPLKGAAPTNSGPFVSGDYNRETGLVGNGTSKYLDTNRNANADPQDNFHMSLYVTESTVASGIAMGAGAANTGSSQVQGSQYRARSGTGDTPTVAWTGAAGLYALSRSESGSYVGRNQGTSQTFTRASQTPHNGNILLYARNSGTNVAGLFSAMRCGFYSIGTSCNLAQLDSRVTTLINDIGAAI